MPLPAAAHLIEFPLAPKVNGAGRDPALPARRSEADAASDVEAALQRGRDEGFAAARAELAAQLAEERVAATDRLSAARSEWTTGEGERIADLIGAAFVELEARLGVAVAEILAPFVGEAMRMRAVEDLARTLAPLLASSDRPVVRVLGPEDLLQALRTSLGAAASSVVLEAGEGIDVQVVADQTRIGTQLAGWLRRLRDESA
jgi:hypothetical protein